MSEDIIKKKLTGHLGMFRETERPKRDPVHGGNLGSKQKQVAPRKEPGL